ncbi:unnamed protein product [Diabrotica balteata]|uniref:Epsilon-sarcoglycan n=1 Tax=Diabrotica balteata TaxID=107213 RepID=A0A9N9T796_DIABA|nr:unnamed protein product [Diabrotica balteata]
MLKIAINLFLLFCTLSNAKDANVLMTEVFAIPLDPPMFNWTYEGFEEQFVYQASLLNAPDLPSWINYLYSEQHYSGFLYGVPPKINENIPLEVVALNKKNYETRVENINIIISEKLNSARYEVLLKIDNINVEDMFDVDRMEALKNVFRKELWKNSAYDLYVTFLNSAVDLGARKPANPREGEGVVIRLGSENSFSTELIELQEEVKPLWKVPQCPRDYKRTSVERYFRDAGFALDWCSFRLVDNNNSAMHHKNGNLVSDEVDDSETGGVWHSVSKADVPQRRYFNELVVSLIVPFVILIVLGLVLSFLLCFQHDEIASHIDDLTSDQISYAETVHRPVETFRSFSNRDSTLSPDLCSHSNSPNSTINRGVHCRPSPPPYVRPKFKSDL